MLEVELVINKIRASLLFWQVLNTDWSERCSQGWIFWEKMRKRNRDTQEGSEGS